MIAKGGSLSDSLMIYCEYIQKLGVQSGVTLLLNLSVCGSAVRSA